MREALAHSLSGPINLDERDWERPVDRLHALASAQIKNARRTAREAHLSSLGVSLIALKSANRADELSRAISRLADCLGWIKPRPTSAMRLRIARQAINEYVIDYCPTCQGRGEVPDQDGLEGAQRMKPCPECGGHGKRRYSDAERMSGLEVERAQYAQAERWLCEGLAFMAIAEAEAVKTARKLLERW